MKIKRGQFSTSLKLCSLHLHKRTVRGFAITSAGTMLYYSSPSLKTKRKIFLRYWLPSVRFVLSAGTMDVIVSGDRYVYNVLRLHVDWCVFNGVSGRVSASIFRIVHEEDSPEYWDTLIWNAQLYQCALPLHSFIHLVICLTTGPKPLPKRTLHIVRSRAVFLNHRAAARYRVLASIIPGRERFSWNLSF